MFVLVVDVDAVPLRLLGDERFRASDLQIIYFYLIWEYFNSLRQWKYEIALCYGKNCEKKGCEKKLVSEGAGEYERVERYAPRPMKQKGGTGNEFSTSLVSEGGTLHNRISSHGSNRSSSIPDPSIFAPWCSRPLPPKPRALMLAHIKGHCSSHWKVTKDRTIAVIVFCKTYLTAHGNSSWDYFPFHA